jgi:hypothetical protein
MNPESPSAALAGLATALEAMRVRWFVSGSLASSLHGVPRSTNDVDIVAELPPEAAGELVSRLGDGYYADEGMIRQAFSRRGSCNLIWLATMMKVDLSPPRFAFDHEAMQRRQATMLTDGGPDGLPIFVCSPEDAILSKLFWYRQGREISQRQLRDIAGIIGTRRDTLDLAYLQRWATTAGISDLLDRALAARG